MNIFFLAKLLERKKGWREMGEREKGYCGGRKKFMLE